MEGITAILVAAGNSTRMGSGGSKQLLPLGGRPLILQTLSAFERAETIEEILLVTREQDKGEIAALVREARLEKLSGIVAGGDTRQQSVLNGVRAARGQARYLVIHDGARPLIRPEEIDAIVREALVQKAVSMAVPVKDTIKLADEARQVVSTPDRAALWAIQTPQVFACDLYGQAMEKALSEGKDYTDDCQLVESLGIPVHLHHGSYRNIKITTGEDLKMAELLWDEAEKAEETPAVIGGGIHSARMGHGYDVHRLVEGRRLILGGVDIPFEKGLLGHSDADVLAHAIADALLGAAALGDIGTLFPDSDPQFEGADSLLLLTEVCRRLREKGYEIVNIDATVVAQAPKLKPYIAEMRGKLSAACKISPEQLNVKATTEEGLGFTGRGEGIAAHAVCCIK